jgi:hypothetical protein
MNNNLEFENTDPSPDSVEDNYPRTNYGEGYYEEPKQEAIEEAALNIIPDRSTSGWVDSFSATERIGFIKGAKWQAERMYSEKEVENIITKLMHEVHTGDICYGNNVIDFKISPRKWFEQFKKK